MDSSLKKKVYFGLGIGFLVYVIFVFMADLESLLLVGGEFPWAYFPLLLLLATGNYLVRMIRWQIYLKKLDIDISFFQGAVVFFSGLAMSVTPGKFGELLKAQYVKNINGTKRRKTGTIIIAERLTDLIGVLIIASFGIYTFNYGEIVFYIVAGVIFSGLVILSSKRLSLWFIRLLKPLPLIGKYTYKLEEAYESISELVKPGVLIGSTVLAVIAWGFEAYGFYMVLNALPDVNVELSFAFFIYAFAILLGAVSMLPGGLGVTEGTMTGLLLLLNVPAAKAVVATLITRLGTLWFAVVIGLVFTIAGHNIVEGKAKKL